MKEFDLLVRLDERVSTIFNSIQRIEKRLEENFVTKSRFLPVEKIAYGLVSAVCITVLLGVVGLVLK